MATHNISNMPRINQGPGRSMISRSDTQRGDLPGQYLAQSRYEQPQLSQEQDHSQELIVGPGMTISGGTIQHCEALMVSGRLQEVDMLEGRLVRITEGGYFKGRLVVDRADIAGTFEGELTAHKHLHIRRTANVIGIIRYGDWEIEKGGNINGDCKPIDKIGG